MSGLLGLLQSAFGGGAPQVQQQPQQAAPTDLAGITATASRPQVAPPAAAPSHPGAGYNNMPEVNAINAVKQQYPQGETGSGLGLSNLLHAHGTLRNILGTLGDAFLIQAGHDPIHAQERYREQIANAGAGFDTDPMGAASRIMATGAPGSATLANQMFETSANRKSNQELKEAQMDSTAAYREGIAADRADRLDLATRAQNEKTDERHRGLIGGLLSRAASTGDPAIYAQARAQALKIRGANSGIDDAEIPEDMHQFMPGYGMNANQVARTDTTRRGQDLGVSNNIRNNSARIGAAGISANRPSSAQTMDNLITKQNNGQKLTTAEQAYFDKQTHIGTGNKTKLAIPGLTPNTAPQASKFQEGQTYKDAKGNRARYSNGKWIPVS